MEPGCGYRSVSTPLCKVPLLLLTLALLITAAGWLWQAVGQGRYQSRVAQLAATFPSDYAFGTLVVGAANNTSTEQVVCPSRKVWPVASGAI